MTLNDRLAAFARLGGFMRRHADGKPLPEEQGFHEALEQLTQEAHAHNNWFLPKYVNDAIANIGGYLTLPELERFAAGVPEPAKPRTVAVVCAGNIPMVGWHDILSVLVSGHVLMLRMSTDDNVLIPFFLRMLTMYESRLEPQIRFASGKLQDFDAVIATGSNNTAAHFRYYFAKYPHIIRHNRTSVAVIDGTETQEELEALGKDIFQYFGLGCRNVSKLYVPEGYSLNRFFESIVGFGEVVNNKKYGNNYDYQRAIYLLERQEFLDNNFLIVKKSAEVHAPVAVLYYETYGDKSEVTEALRAQEKELQCVVGHGFLPFGYSQQPVITDYADHVNTLSFLVNL